MADGILGRRTVTSKNDNTNSLLTQWRPDVEHNELRNYLYNNGLNIGKVGVPKFSCNNPTEVIITSRLNSFSSEEFIEVRVHSVGRTAKKVVKETIENFQTQKLSVEITTMPSFVEATMQKKKLLVIERDNLIVIENNMAIESVKDLNLDSKKWVCYNLETIGWDETLRLVEKARHLAHEKGILFLKQVVFIKETLSIEKQLKGLSIFGEAGATFRKYSKDKTFSEVINLFEEEIKKTRKLVEDHRKR